ncbi:ABC-ATPase domain-containing protein [Clostridium sp. LBM24168]
MKNHSELQKILYSIDGSGYSSYKKIKGAYDLGDYVLFIDHVQSDPFAPPSKCHVNISRKTAGFPDELINSKHKITAVCDFLTRTFENSIKYSNNRKNGTGKSGLIIIDSCGQEMLERTSIIIKKDYIDARFEIGLPAAGRRVLGKTADNIFSNIIPKIVDNSLIYKNINHKPLKDQVTLILDQEYIRDELIKRKLVAFISNGSILPRESGVSDKPLLSKAVPFKSPKNFETEMLLPSKKTVRGMGIPEGITLIVGGGYHGKSTLLRALELGVYNHIPEDGRELVITRNDAVKIRAEDGRSIEKVNISPFINHLPNNKDTLQFSTENASGSTSQAANVMEALEAGTKLLLIDEDTSATNFMIRDGRMQKLVSKDKEPITPFIDKIRPLYKDYGVSTILIVGGSGDYFDEADHVVMMDEYIPKDVTKIAREITKAEGYKREKSGESNFGDITQRVIAKYGSIQKETHNKIKAKGKHLIIYNKSAIDLSGLEQLVDDSQTNCIAAMLEFLEKKIVDDKITISQAVDKLFKQIDDFGMESIFPYQNCPGNLALPRKYEVHGAINRYRELNIK